MGLDGPGPRRTVLVTGGTRGIGREVVRLLAPTWHVRVGGRSADGVACVVADCPDAAGFVCDLADGDAVAAAVAGLDRLDAVVHSAGVAVRGSAEEVSRSEFRRVLELNVVAVADSRAWCCRGFGTRGARWSW